jgi:hypothetical protein
MSGFECKISELNGTDNISSFETNTTTGTNTNTKTNTKTNQDVNQAKTTNTSTSTSKLSGFSKILNEKNIKTILVITVIYFFLQSEQVLEFVNAKIPSLTSNLLLNAVGKIIFGLLIGVSFIVYSFFFQDP